MENISQFPLTLRQTPEEQVENLLLPFRDPCKFDHGLFDNPVVLPCFHTFDESSVNKIIYIASRTMQVPKCPLDDIPFTRYVINYNLRDARGTIEELIRQSKKESPPLLPEEENSPQVHSHQLSENKQKPY